MLGQIPNLRAWLFTILRNTYFSECRKRRREVEDRDGSRAAQLSVYPNEQGHLDMQDFRRALNMLPADQREALVLAAGFSYEDAASVSGCAVGTIKSRVNRVRRKLAEALRRCRVRRVRAGFNDRSNRRRHGRQGTADGVGRLVSPKEGGTAWRPRDTRVAPSSQVWDEPHLGAFAEAPLLHPDGIAFLQPTIATLGIVDVLQRVQEEIIHQSS